MSLDERALEIITRMKTLPMDESRRLRIEADIKNAMPRYRRYRNIIFSLAGVSSHKEL